MGLHSEENFWTGGTSRSEAEIARDLKIQEEEKALRAFQAIFADQHNYYHLEYFAQAPLSSWLSLCVTGEKSSVQLRAMVARINTPENSFQVIGVKKYKAALLGRKPENNWYFEATIEQRFEGKTFIRCSTQYYSETNKHMFV